MNWPALFNLLLAFFGPLLREWLDELFTRAEPKLGPPSPSTPAAVAALFAGARAELSWWQFRRRAALAACERIALARAPEIAAALAGTGPRPSLRADEARALFAAL